MALVVEDGSVVVGAETYVDAATARAFAAKRGVTLDAADGPVEILLLKAMDYLRSLEEDWQGNVLDPTQVLAWPRYDVYLGGYLQDSGVIPQGLKDAQCQLAIEAVSRDLQPVSDGREVIRKKVDVLETEYAPGAGGNPQPGFPKVAAFLRPLLRQAPGSLVVGRA